MRASGILLHISSLPSRYGIGTLGKCAYEFVNFLKASGQSYWQMLPLTTTGYGDSPYQSFSVFAGNPYFIDLDMLQEEGLLVKQELQSYANRSCASSVDYGWLFEWRDSILHQAYQRFDCDHSAEFQAFCHRNAYWLDGFAQFMVIKKHFNHQSWQSWPKALRKRDKSAMQQFAASQQDIDFYRFLQFMFFRQFEALKRYAKKNGIKLIGDIPIYVAEDSTDVWCHPELFLLDAQNRLIEMAGCPPDFFSPDGQAWGNPVYNWHNMVQDDYAWWILRIQYMMRMYDVIRIDHFRGFAGYFSYPAGQTPAQGSWKKGPGMALFERIHTAFPNIHIIAEDLGFLDDDVRALLQQTGFPGMKVLQFAFDSREQSDYMPHHYERNCVVYTGTHDNDTVAGWYDTGNSDDVARAGAYFAVNQKEEYPWALIRGAWASVADLAIAPMQDFLQLGSSARMNTPATVGGNWKWRMQQHMLCADLAQKIYRMTELYGRLK